MSISKRFVAFSSAAIVLMAVAQSSAGELYPDPAGGWTYQYGGDAAAGGAGFTALDGTWSHDNGSDEWDESTIGTGRPGGVTGGLVDGSTTYVRLQETGDPRDYGMGDPGSIRKIYLGHDTTAEGASATVLDDGVTLSFRARIATGTPLDDAHPDGGSGIVPWPAGGDGYMIHDAGKGNFSLHQSAGANISFSLALEGDGAANPTGALLMNNLNGSAVSGDVDTGEAGTVNEVALDNPAMWNEFWITVAGGGTGTHQVSVYKNGSLSADVFDVTAGTGNDFGDISYIAMGLGSTGQSGAIDVDFVAWAPGAIAPVPEPSSVILLVFGIVSAWAISRPRRNR